MTKHQPRCAAADCSYPAIRDSAFCHNHVTIQSRILAEKRAAEARREARTHLIGR